jgi:hypothetical protein
VVSFSSAFRASACLLLPGKTDMAPLQMENANPYCVAVPRKV